MPLRRRGVRDRVDRVVLRVDRARRVVRDGVVLHNAHVVALVLRLLMLLVVVLGVVVLVAGVVRGVEVAAVLRVVRHGCGHGSIKSTASGWVQERWGLKNIHFSISFQKLDLFLTQLFDLNLLFSKIWKGGKWSSNANRI
jgi:hypothetical protein